MSKASDYRDYQRLCDRVEKIDAEAARWLREEAPKMSRFSCDGDLSSCFLWGMSPHGHDFWENIDEALRRRTGSARMEMMEDFFKPEVDEDNATLAANREEIAPQRGSVLREAIDTINGQRQDSYGNPEDSFERIANLWDAYLSGKYGSEIDLTAEDVALMMTLMKIARMMTGSGHRDSYVDAAGYIGLAADMGVQ